MQRRIWPFWARYNGKFGVAVGAKETDIVPHMRAVGLPQI